MKLNRAPPIRGRDPPTSCRRYCPRYPGSARDNQPVMRRRPHPGAGTVNTIGVASLDARSSPCNGRLSLSGSIEPIIMRALPFIKLSTEDRLESLGTVEIVHGNSEMNHSGHNAPFLKMSIYDEARAVKSPPLYRCVVKPATAPRMLLPESIILK